MSIKYVRVEHTVFIQIVFVLIGKKYNKGVCRLLLLQKIKNRIRALYTLKSLIEKFIYYHSYFKSCFSLNM